MKNYKKALWVLCMIITSCSGEAKQKKETQAVKPHSDEPAHETLPQKLRLSSSVVAQMQIRTLPAVRKVLATTLSLPGEIAANPDRVADVASPVTGRITRVNFQEGSQVKKGEVLLSIRVPEVGNIQASQVTATVGAKAARANANRLQALVNKGLAAQQEALSANAEAESLEAQARASHAQLKALGAGTAGESSELSLRASISGIVISRDAVVGQPVTVNAALATIADISQVWFLARVFEKDLAYVKKDSEASVQLNAFPGERFSGKIAYISQQIDAVGRTLTARIPLVNRDDKLRVGLFGTAFISTSQDHTLAPVLVISRDAVTEIGGKSVVFVKHNDGDFAIHEVVLGQTSLSEVEVISGLREGEQTVVDGVFNLKSAILKNTFSEDE